VRRSASSGECNADNLRDRHASTMASYLLARDRWFESASPQRRVRNEPASGRTPNPLGFTVGTPYDGRDELWAAVGGERSAIRARSQTLSSSRPAAVNPRAIHSSSSDLRPDRGEGDEENASMASGPPPPVRPPHPGGARPEPAAPF
jgi:hypothetical protein